MGQFFRQRHPWIMQAVGGLIALIVFAPIAAIAWINLIANAKPQQAAVTYAPPGTVAAGNPQGAQTVQPNATGGNSPSGGKVYTVNMQPGHAAAGFVFSPSSLTIHTGDTVRWVDVNSTPHNIVGQGSAASVINRTAINIDPYSVTFTKAGTYHYLCQIHPGMVGIIKVVGGTVPSSAASNGGVGPGTQLSGSTVTVKMQPGHAAAGFVFSPATVTISKGTTVHWVDANSTPHNIVGQGSAASVINRTAINTDPYSVKFTTTGTYHYLCQIHPGMVGVVIVK